MQQDTYFYNLPSTFSQDASRIQFPNTNSFVQPSINPWSSNYIPDVNTVPQPNVYSGIDKSGVSCGGQPQHAPLLTPVSTAAYGTTSTFSWAHTVPSLMPWVSKGESNAPDPIVRFTAPFPPDPCTSQTATSWELLNNLGANKTNVNMHLKRKSDLDVLETAPQKVCITEERMAARLRELHISNQYSVPLENSPFGPYGDSSTQNLPEKSVTNLQQLESMMKQSKTGVDMSSKSLILAPELKKLVEPDKIFSSAFLDKIERPSMAVVLWQPQNSMLTGLNNNKSKNEEEERSENSICSVTEVDNNNFLSQEMSAMCDQNVSFSSLEDSSSHINSDDVMDT